MRFETSIALLITAALIAPRSAAGQQAALAPEAGSLKIVVVQGENSKNDVRTKFAEQPVVEIRDEADKPLAGAEVVFQLPWTGPGGVFYDWLKIHTVRTGTDGRAAARGLTPNDEEGRFNIKVTATHGMRTASAVIAQSNVRTSGNGAAVNGRSRKRLWTTVAIIGAGVLAGGIYAATRDDNGSSSTAAPIVIAPGPIAVGGPR